MPIEPRAAVPTDGDTVSSQVIPLETQKHHQCFVAVIHQGTGRTAFVHKRGTRYELDTLGLGTNHARSRAPKRFEALMIFKPIQRSTCGGRAFATERGMGGFHMVTRLAPVM